MDPPYTWKYIPEVTSGCENNLAFVYVRRTPSKIKDVFFRNNSPFVYSRRRSYILLQRSVYALLFVVFAHTVTHWRKQIDPGIYQAVWRSVGEGEAGRHVTNCW